MEKKAAQINKRLGERLLQKEIKMLLRKQQKLLKKKEENLIIFELRLTNLQQQSDNTQVFFLKSQ